MVQSKKKENQRHTRAPPRPPPLTNRNPPPHTTTLFRATHMTGRCCAVQRRGSGPPRLAFQGRSECGCRASLLAAVLQELQWQCTCSISRYGCNHVTRTKWGVLLATRVLTAAHAASHSCSEFHENCRETVCLVLCSTSTRVRDARKCYCLGSLACTRHKNGCHRNTD